jgi:periplasmic protein TonB
MDRRQQMLRRLPGLLGALVVLVFVAVAIWLIHGYLTNKDVKPERKVQVVQVIRPAPPPPEEKPPPPPPEQKPEEPLPQDEPEPAPSDAPSPSESLGLDADGSAGGDAFGLAAHKGGRDITGSGGAIFAWYTTRLKDQVVERLSDDTRIRSKKFSVSVRVWIEPDGRIREVKLGSTTGNRDLDSAIEAALSKLARMGEPPPIEMPQPISLKIVSRS